MTPFHIGMKVVCVKTPNATPCKYWPVMPQKGNIYTIRSILKNDHGKIGLRLHEIICGIHHIEKIECAFFTKFFRPLIKTDISIFEAMLVPTKNDIRILGSNWPDCLTEEVRQFFEEVRQNVST